MNRLLILGKGRLGQYLADHACCYGINPTLISIRTDTTELTNLNFDLIVDTMDPATTLSSKETTRSIISDLRVRALKANYKRYIYLSTAKVYVPSTKECNELSPILNKNQKGLDAYISNKLLWEDTIKQTYYSGRESIFRLVSLWDFNPKKDSESFFDDLVISRINNKRLPTRCGDNSVVSYMNYIHAAHKILSLISNKCTNHLIWNITAGLWASRTELKENKSMHNPEKGLGLRITSAHDEIQLFPECISSLL